jgi:endonuclease/exonuclease/phosphatase family metal-dependent hydrolase
MMDQAPLGQGSGGMERPFRIMTYNVHRCIGTDGKLSPQRNAEVIAACDPDVVALQELDVGRLRTGNIDQAAFMAKALGMQPHFHPALRELGEQCGDAILTKALRPWSWPACCPAPSPHAGANHAVRCGSRPRSLALVVCPLKT